MLAVDRDEDMVTAAMMDAGVCQRSGFEEYVQCNQVFQLNERLRIGSFFTQKELSYQRTETEAIQTLRPTPVESNTKRTTIDFGSGSPTVCGCTVAIGRFQIS